MACWWFRDQWSVVSDQDAFDCLLILPSSLKKVAVGRMMHEEISGHHPFSH